MTCEDYPCCGHEQGCCPSFDENGKQLDMACLCGKRLPITSKSSMCESCLDGEDDEQRDSEFFRKWLGDCTEAERAELRRLLELP